MAVRPRWIRNEVRGVDCPECMFPLEVDGVRGVQVILERFGDGRKGFAAASATLIATCPSCGMTWEHSVDQRVKPSHLKLGVTWLLSRLGEIRNPFYGGRDDDVCDCEGGSPGIVDERSSEGAKEAGVDSGGGTGSGAKEKASPPPLEFDQATGAGNAGEVPPLFRQRRVTPSVRPTCPRQPITDETVARARRQLRQLSDDRRRPGYARLMRKLGIDIETGKQGDQS